MAKNYIEEKKSLYCLDHIINLALNGKAFMYSTSKDNKPNSKSESASALDIKIIGISDEGVYVKGEIISNNKNQFKATSNDKVKVIPSSYFTNNKVLKKRLEDYIMSRPRLKVIPGSFTVDDENIIENMVMVLVPLRNTDNVDTVEYKVVKLYDADGRFMRSTMAKLRDRESREKLYVEATIQGRFNDTAMYDAITLALRGYTRGMIKDGVIYARVVENGEQIQTPISASNLNPNNYTQCDVDDRIELERFGCTIKNTRYTSIGMTYIRLANILGDEGRHIKYSETVKKILQRQTGIVYLKNTLAEEVISTFYPCKNTLVSNTSIYNPTITGAYISHKGDNISYSNPDLIVIPISYDNCIEEDKNGKKSLTEGLGMATNSVSFYIIEQDVLADPEILSAMSDNSIVFVLSEFGNLSGLARQISGSEDIDLMVEKIIFAGSLVDDEGLFMHPYIMHLIKEEDLYELKRLPMNMSRKSLDGKILRYSDMIGKILTSEGNISEIVLTDQIQVVKDGILQRTNAAFKDLSYGELLNIYMLLTNYDMYEILGDKGIYRTIIKYPIQEQDSETYATRTYQVPFRITVTEMKNTIGKPPLKISLKPVRVQTDKTSMNLGSLYTEKKTGIFLLCGEPYSGKGQVLQNICNSLPNRGKILIFDPEYEVIGDFFRNDGDKEAMGLDLTISRSRNYLKIEELIRERPDTIIVNKINSYDEKIVGMLLMNYYQSQRLIFVYDGLFTDFLEKLNTKQVNRLLDCMNIATNQVMFKDKTNSIKIVYECFDRDTISTLSLQRGIGSHSIAGKIYNFMQASAQGLQRQLAELNREGNLSLQEYKNLMDIIRRYYILEEKNLL